jgi:outer membrane protein
VGSRSLRPLRVGACLLLAAAALSTSPARSETIIGALTKAYQSNSQLNSARAGVRVTDEDVPIAKSGYRPFIAATGSLEFSANGQSGSEITTGSFGVSIQQNLFDGFQTKNNVRAAKSRVRAAQYALENTEQNILFNAAAAYMDVIRDRQIAVLTQRNLAFLDEQVRAARSRFEVGEGTRTDVAQATASQAAAMAQLSAARARALASAAIYRQVIGDEPDNLEPTRPVGGLPGSLEQAHAISASEHPAILATLQLVDASDFAVKSSEGALLPGVSLRAGVSQGFTDSSISGYSDGTSANVGLTLTVPIYQGGLASAQVRQSKEALGQARIEVDVSRDQVRAALTSAWTQFRSAQETVSANRELVAAAQLALSGVVEERSVGQRTTLDVLNAQADVITAQINQVSAERDVVVASYAILSAMGRLSVTRLGLPVEEYDPQEHYRAVKDKWYGLRTPDGR